MQSPSSYQLELDPMQGKTYGRHVDPNGVPLFQDTTTRSTNLPPPRDHIIWSICNFVHMNVCCLGLAALYHSVKSRDLKVAGDLESARKHGSTARRLNIIALTLGIFLLIAMVVLIAFMSHYYVSLYYSHGNGHGYGRGYGSPYD